MFNRTKTNNRFDIGLYEKDKPLLWSLNPCFHRKMRKMCYLGIHSNKNGSEYLQCRNIREVDVPNNLEIDSRCQRPVVCSLFKYDRLF